MSNNYPIRINSDLKARLREAALRDGFRHLSKWLLWLAENRAQETEPKETCVACGNQISGSGLDLYCASCYTRFTAEGFFGMGH